MPGLLGEIAAGERVGSDGYVIACFGDPGLDAARELERGPVVGIAEAAMRTRLLPGPRRGTPRTPSCSAARAWRTSPQISDAIGVPVIDGVAAATRTVETLVALGLRTGSRGEFAPPPAKPYAGVLRDFRMP